MLLVGHIRVNLKKWHRFVRNILHRFIQGDWWTSKEKIVSPCVKAFSWNAQTWFLQVDSWVFVPLSLSTECISGRHLLHRKNQLIHVSECNGNAISNTVFQNQRTCAYSRHQVLLSTSTQCRKPGYLWVRSTLSTLNLRWVACLSVFSPLRRNGRE